MLNQILQKIGLEEKEIQVYLMSLRLGVQPASVIARRAGLPRNTARFILDALVKEGLIKKTKRGNTQLYVPEQPDNILNVIEMKRNRNNAVLDEQTRLVKSVMAELKSLHQPESTRPKVTFYEGDEGLEKVYENTLTSSETIRSFASFDGMHGALPEYFKNYYKRRAENKILIKSIHPDTPLAREKTENDKKEWRESRLVPADRYSFDPEIQFYDNKIVITSWKEKLGIFIESHEIYRAMAVAFELAWQEAARLDPRLKKGKQP